MTDPRSTPSIPVAPRHTNKAGVEFVTVECPKCRFSHSHRSELEARPTPVEPEAPDDEATPFQRGYNLGLHHGLSRRLAVEPDGLPLDVERLAAEIHERTCLAPSWDKAATRHRRWDVQAMQERVDLYARAGYRIVASTPSEAKP